MNTPEWIEWSGGECPVLPGSDCEVKFRDGGTIRDCEPETWTWSQDNEYVCRDREIVAYRLWSPPLPDDQMVEYLRKQGYTVTAPAITTITVSAATIELRPGEHYAGLVLQDDGQPSHHLVLMAARPDERLAWQAATEWAVEVDGTLPTRREQSLIYAHCRAHVDHGWHWSSETYEANASHAWSCSFLYGAKSNDRKSLEARAVAVRRIPIGDEAADAALAATKTGEQV